MLKIARVLFPTDFTEHAEGAFSHAAHLAAWHGAGLDVLNVASPHEPEGANPMDYLPLERSTKTEQLYLAADAQQGVPVRYRQVRRAAPAEAILAYADEHDADLIVMGTRGRQGVDRFLNASVAEEVVRRASCPTLTVRTGGEGEAAEAARPAEHVLVPVDFSENARLQVAHAAALAEGSGAALHLLHIIEEAVFPTFYGVDAGAPPASAVVARTETALQELADSLAPVIPPGTPVRTHVRTGHPAPGVVAFAEEHACALIVVATHGRTGLERFLMGSVAEQVVRTAPCPVFTVRPFGKSLVEEVKEEAARSAEGEA